MAEIGASDLTFVGADEKYMKALRAERDRNLAKIGDLESRCKKFRNNIHAINEVFQNAKELRQFAAFIFEIGWDAGVLFADRTISAAEDKAHRCITAFVAEQTA